MHPPHILHCLELHDLMVTAAVTRRTLPTAPLAENRVQQSTSITQRRKLFLMHSRNLQEIPGQVSPLGQWNASPSKRHPPPCTSSCANCLTMLWQTCQSCLPTLLPRAALCGHGGWHNSSWPHTHLISYPHESCHFLAGLSTAWSFPRSGPLPSPIHSDTLLCYRICLLFNSAINVLLITMWSTTISPSMMNINCWKDDKNFRDKHMWFINMRISS